MVLLVIDAQKGITNEKIYNFEGFVSTLQGLIQAARENDIEVIYVRHDDGEGKPLTKGNDEFEVSELFAPLGDERIFDKNVNSPFRDSGLLEYLVSKNEKTIIITGLQTDYCIDASVKCGFEHGFEVIVPENANSTVDNPYMSAEDTYKYYNGFIWNRRYARCIPAEEVIAMMNG